MVSADLDLTAEPDLSAADPYELLRMLLADDRDAGLDWSPVDFAQRVALVARVTRAGRAWMWLVISTYPTWQRAYAGDRDGALEKFELRSLLLDI